MDEKTRYKIGPTVKIKSNCKNKQQQNYGKVAWGI